MPPPLPDTLRQRVWQSALEGLSAQAIASALRLPPRTVYHLLRQFRSVGRPTEPDYRCCGRRPDPRLSACHPVVLSLRDAHPGWGASRIQAELTVLSPERPVPDDRTIRRWLEQAGRSAARPRPGPDPAPRATSTHQVWQMDAAEKKRLRSGTAVCWLRMVDEASGAALFTQVFVSDRWSGVPTASVQDALRRAFTVWGRPGGLRVDNGVPWACTDSDLPSDLALWLAGLDVATHRNRPHQPQQNGKVERSQRTAADWAEPGGCDTSEQLQVRLAEEDRVHREVQRFDGRQTRLEAYPSLRCSGRPYLAGVWEEVCWDLSAALRSLAACVVRRKVDRGGEAWLYDQRYWVGKGYAGRVLTVRLDWERGEWTFADDGQEVTRAPAKGLTEAAIRGLAVRRRVGRSAAQTAARRAGRDQAGKAEQPAGRVPAAPTGGGCP